MVASFLGGLGESSRLGMVIVDQKARLTEAVMEVTGSEAKARFLNTLDEEVNYRGQFSNTPAGIEMAIYELRTNGRDDANKAIIFLSDGIVDTGDRTQDLAKEKWLREDLARESKKAGIRIFGIAFKNTADFSIIQTLALKTDGEYFRAYKAEDIHDVFRTINQEISKSTAMPATQISSAIDKVKPALLETEPGVPQAKLETESAMPPQSKTESMIAPPQKVQYVEKEGIALPLVLAGIAVFLGAIATIIMLLRGKTKTSVKAGAVDEATALITEPVPPLPQAMLVDVKNITAKKTLTLSKRTISIGRGANNDVAIPKDNVSGFHATIEYKDGHFYLEDQRSKNKTRLNGEVIEPYSPKRLKSGDEIMLTHYRFIFLIAYQTPSGETLVWREN
jgi:hypothetical protein